MQEVGCGGLWWVGGGLWWVVGGLWVVMGIIGGLLMFYFML